VNLLGLTTSWLGPGLGSLLGRMLSRPQSLSLAQVIADRIAADGESPTTNAIRSNQAQVRGLSPADPALDDIIHTVLRNTAAGYADWFWAMARGGEAMASLLPAEGYFVDEIHSAISARSGLLIVGPHLGNFNLLMLAMVSWGLDFQVLSLANPSGNYNVENALRARFGLQITPISTSSLKQAMHRLRQGGVVLTGVDRPDPAGELLEFFGRPARLSVGHARMAISTGARLLVGACLPHGEDRYRADVIGLLEGRKDLPREAAVIRLAKATLECLEREIRRQPDLWSMFIPVWG
jgi:lauroyl/myristoyl acyltransferase